MYTGHEITKFYGIHFAHQRTEGFSGLLYYIKHIYTYVTECNIYYLYFTSLTNNFRLAVITENLS